jgi:hypothetical protein
MIGRACVIGVVLFGLAVFAAADEPVPGQPEPPVRLRKKVKPSEQVRPPSGPEHKPEPKEPRQELLPANVEEDSAEKLTRLLKNMRASEERLAKEDVSDATRRIQRDILADLDAILQPPPQSANRDAQSKDQKPSRSANRRNSRERERTQTVQKQGTQSPRRAPTPSQANMGSGGRRKDAPGENKLGDLYKDIWGHLPETLRQEMDQYSREQFMAKYNDLLKQYYSTIAEKGRRKGD